MEGCATCETQGHRPHRRGDGACPSYLERQRAYAADRYANDPAYREQARARQRGGLQNGQPYDPAARRDRGLKRLYGISQEQFDALLVAQGGRCAICRTDEPGGKDGRFQVDHDHNTGVVRGLLCLRCNVGIGSLGDDPDRLRDALRYLLQTQLREVI